MTAWHRTLLRHSLLAVAASAASLAGAQDITVFTGRTMGTTFNVRAVLPQSASAEEAGQRISDCLEQVNEQMSTYIVDSELSRFNQSDETDMWFEVSPATAKVVAYSLELAADSNGAFDPTVGPVVDLWGFGPDRRKPEPPSEEELAEARKVVGYEKIEARLDPPALRKSVAGVELNLSAVAKGYGVDAVCEILDDLGCKSYLVEIGGEVRTLGTKPAGLPWQIGVERESDRGGPTATGFSRIVPLTDEALATSGDYRNFFEYQGKRYSHTIDPATGHPVEHTLATVTVRAETCMQADAIATAILVLGPSAGYDWAKQRNIAAILVERTDEGLRETLTPAWEAREPADQPATGSTMWTYIVITAVVFGIAIIGMALGVIFSNRRIQGSCGGLAGMQDESGNTACQLCSNPSPTCSGNPEEKSSSQPV